MERPKASPNRECLVIKRENIVGWPKAFFFTRNYVLVIWSVIGQNYVLRSIVTKQIDARLSISLPIIQCLQLVVPYCYHPLKLKKRF